MYTCFTLDPAAQYELITRLQRTFPLLSEKGEFICHHVTVNMGGVQDGPAAWIPLGMSILMEPTHVGILGDHDVVAFRMKGVNCDIPTVNKHAHVTMYVRRDRGAKPVMSNDITDWEPFEGPQVYGTLKEC